MEFLKNFDSDIKSTLIAQLRDLWNHTSKAIEGNTLTLGETKFVIEEGLTVSGKPSEDSSNTPFDCCSLAEKVMLNGYKGLSRIFK